MLLGFADQFVPFVEQGSKTHTIRAGERWAVGMRADCYAKPRQRGMRLLFRAPVVRVERIYIAWREFGTIRGDGSLTCPVIRLTVAINGDTLSPDETEAFFERDGFRKITNSGKSSTQMAGEFWRGDLPFVGQLIHWDYRLAVRPPAALCGLGKRLHAPSAGWVTTCSAETSDATTRALNDLGRKGVEFAKRLTKNGKL